MANIFINGLKAKVGGGKMILDNYLLQLSVTNTAHTYFVLTPDKQHYREFERPHVILVDVKSAYKKNLLFPVLYFIELPKLLRRLSIDLVLNFGDVIIPSKRKQIYFFDWAYAVYREKYLWEKMPTVEWFTRKLKVFLIGFYISEVALTIAQTRSMAQRLVKEFKISRIHVTPTPLGKGFGDLTGFVDFRLDQKRFLFLFPASYAAHKNFRLLLPLAEMIRDKKLPFSIVITLERSSAKDLFRELEHRGLQPVIINVGKTEGRHMPALYQQCHALFLPTLLESYGLPYIEAMQSGKPVVTSDLDFAREMCGDAGYYFDPFDPSSALESMMSVYSDADLRDRRTAVGKERLREIPTWKEVFRDFEIQIDAILKNCKTENV